MKWYNSGMRGIPVSVLALLLFGACSAPQRPEYIPKYSKDCGQHLISCKRVKRGLFYCEIYDSKNYTLTTKGNFVADYAKDSGKGLDISQRVLFYNGTNIFLKGGMELVPTGIPDDALRTHSRKGGVWVSYRQSGKDPQQYFCQVFSELDGTLISKGEYTLKKYYWSAKAGKTIFARAAAPARPKKLKFYNGIVITMEESLLFFPASPINYPQGNTFGKIIAYDNEGNVKDERIYSF